MASVRGTSGVFDTASGTHQVTSTATISDYILILAAHTGSTAQPTITDSSGGTYAVVNSAFKATSADKMYLFARNARATATGQISFTVAPGTTSGGGFGVFYIAGLQGTNAGTTAIKQSAIVSNIATTGTMTVTFAAQINVNNLVAGGIFNLSNPANVTAPSGFTRDQNLGYNNPATGLATFRDDSGVTGTIILSGGTSTPYGAILAEVDTANSATVTIVGQAATFATGILAQARAKSLLGIGRTFAQQQFPDRYVDGVRGTEDGTERSAQSGELRITERYVFINAISVTVTGQQISFATGAPSVVRADALTGQAVTAATGTIRAALAKAISGVQATFATGSFANKVRADALTGQAVTTAQGAFGKTHTNAIVGRAATFATGIITYGQSQSATVTLNGTSAAFATGTMAKEHANALTGRAATFATGILANVRSDALTGQAATFAQGSMQRVHTNAITGRAATFATGILTQTRAKTLAGQPATFATGTLARVHTNALTGKQATFATGNVQVQGNQQALLQGVVAQFSQGVLTYSGPAPGPAGNEGFFPVLRPRHRHRR